MTAVRVIPQCDPRASYLAQSAEIGAAIARVLAAGRYILGPAVESFESNFAAHVGVNGALGVANGTDAIELALRALGIGSGDIVVTVSHTAVATTAAIRSAGAAPLYVDVDEGEGLMDLERLEELLELARLKRISVPLARIKAIIPVHLYGACLDMQRLLALAEHYNVPIVEDCAQAHGAQWDGRCAGSFGIVGCFSFYPTKNLGAIGDGGALVSSNADLLMRARLLRQYGWQRRYISDIEGTNSRLDELQAAILDVKLSRLDEDNRRRIQIADDYRASIRHPAIRRPACVERKRHVYHQFAIRCANRDRLQQFLKENGIGTLVHYPCPVHLQPAYASPDYTPLPLPNTEAWAQSVLSLPIYPQLSDSDVGYVCAAINRWTGN